MADGKKESGPKRWFKSIVEHNSSSSRSEGQASGATSPTTNTASGSAMSLPPSSSEYDSNSLTPTRLTTDAQSNHTAITSGTSPDMPEELIQSRQQQTTATGNARINAQDSQVLHSNAHAVVRDEVTLDRGKFIPSTSSVIVHSTNTSSRSNYIGSLNGGAGIGFSILWNRRAGKASGRNRAHGRTPPWGKK